MSAERLGPKTVGLLEELLEIVRQAFEHGVHVEDCPFLHYSVADDDWSKCACWYGRARVVLGITKPKEPRR